MKRAETILDVCRVGVMFDDVRVESVVLRVVVVIVVESVVGARNIGITNDGCGIWKKPFKWARVNVTQHISLEIEDQMCFIFFVQMIICSFTPKLINILFFSLNIEIFFTLFKYFCVVRSRFVRVDRDIVEIVCWLNLIRWSFQWSKIDLKWKVNYHRCDLQLKISSGLIEPFGFFLSLRKMRNDVINDWEKKQFDLWQRIQSMMNYHIDGDLIHWEEDEETVVFIYSFSWLISVENRWNKTWTVNWIWIDRFVETVTFSSSIFTNHLDCVIEEKKRVCSG